MTEYTSARALALRLIGKKGQPVTIKRYADPAPADPAMPWRVGAGAVTEYPTVGIVLDFRPDQVEGYAYQRGDKLCLIPAQGLSIVLLDTDIIHVDATDEDWAIIQPSRIYPANEDVLFQNYVRRWPRRST